MRTGWLERNTETIRSNEKDVNQSRSIPFGNMRSIWMKVTTEIININLAFAVNQHLLKVFKTPAWGRTIGTRTTDDLSGYH